jgi:hypothetical protein
MVEIVAAALSRSGVLVEACSLLPATISHNRPPFFAVLPSIGVPTAWATRPWAPL